MTLALVLAMLVVIVVLVLQACRLIRRSYADTARMAIRHFAASGATEATARIAGRTVILRRIAHDLVELRNLPCLVAQDLDAACIIGAGTDPVLVTVSAADL